MPIIKTFKESMHCVGEFQSRLLLTTLYFVCLGPFALMAGSGDPLKLKDFADGTTGWYPRRADSGQLEQAGQQY